jgi:hypothetical protein
MKSQFSVVKLTTPLALPAHSRFMRVSFLRAILTSATIIFAATRCSAFDFARLDFPGANETSPADADGDLIVGSYSFGSFSIRHGFVFDGANYSTLDYPGAESTTLTGVDRTRIVGYYSDGTRQRGFVFDGQSFATVDPPLTSPIFFNGSESHGVSGSRIVGGYIDVQSKTHGYVFDGMTYATIDHPLSTGVTTAVDIEGAHIIGSYSTGTGNSGYLFNGTDFRTIDVPFPGTLGTVPLGISGNSLVGYYAAPGAKGFFFDGLTYAKVDVPSNWGGATAPLAISGNLIVGQYVDASQRIRGFVATIPEPGASSLVAVALVLFRRTRVRTLKNA